MLNDIILKIKKVSTNYFYLIIIALITFAISIILGFFLIGSNYIKESLELIALNYFNKIICDDFNAFNFLFNNILSLAFTFIILGIFLTNKFTFYVSLIVVVYNGYVFGVFLNIFIFKLGITGIVVFAFTILIRYACFTLAMILLMVFSKYLIDKKCNKINNVIKVFLFSLIIALIGVVIELLMIITILRPINLLF